MTSEKFLNKLKKYQLISVILLAAVATHCRKTTTLLDDLIGTWKTSNIHYFGTFFELKRDVIIFGTKDGDVNTYKIIEIKKQKMENNEWDSYTIFYQDDDLHKVEFSFLYHASDTQVIRFKNQRFIVWKKETRIKT